MPDESIVMTTGSVARAGLRIGGGGGKAKGAEERSETEDARWQANLAEFCRTENLRVATQLIYDKLAEISSAHEILNDPKTSAADWHHGEIVWAEVRLVGMGVICGNIQEMSKDNHLMVAAIANSGVWVAFPTRPGVTGEEAG